MGVKIKNTLTKEEMARSSMSDKKKRLIRQIKVSEKRQITIPKQFFDKLGIGGEMICELRGNEIVLRRIPQTEDFSEEILKDLVAQGFEGENLIREFQKVKSKIRPAVEKLIEESSLAAQSLYGNGNDETEDLFGDLKE